MAKEMVPIQEHNMRELSAMVDAVPEEIREIARNYVEGFMDGQLRLFENNRFAFGLYTMQDAEDRATLNTIEATCARFGIERTPVDQIKE